jgi:hypothetical protein
MTARITYGGSFGNKIAAAVSQLQVLKANLNRAKTIADDLTAGAGTAALEGSAEFNASNGGGSTLYNDLATIVAALNATSLTSALTDLDQG